MRCRVGKGLIDMSIGRDFTSLLILNCETEMNQCGELNAD